jgi:hypothetical protein
MVNFLRAVGCVEFAVLAMCLHLLIKARNEHAITTDQYFKVCFRFPPPSSLYFIIYSLLPFVTGSCAFLYQ